jgi:hypothetical protein
MTLSKQQKKTKTTNKNNKKTNKNNDFVQPAMLCYARLKHQQQKTMTL